MIYVYKQPERRNRTGKFHYKLLQILAEADDDSHCA